MAQPVEACHRTGRTRRAVARWHPSRLGRTEMLTRGTTTRKIERRVATLVVMSVVMAVAAGSSAGATGGVLKRGQTISFTSPNPSPVNVGGTYTPTASASPRLCGANQSAHISIGL